jgi:hypothetical protein
LYVASERLRTKATVGIRRPSRPVCERREHTERAINTLTKNKKNKKNDNFFGKLNHATKKESRKKSAHYGLLQR